MHFDGAASAPLAHMREALLRRDGARWVRVRSCPVHTVAAFYVSNFSKKRHVKVRVPGYFFVPSTGTRVEALTSLSHSFLGKILTSAGYSQGAICTSTIASNASGAAS